jgi:hypothetical protein
MPVNSITPSQAVQSAQAIKKSEVAEARKQSSVKEANIRDANKAQDRKNEAVREAQVQRQAAQNKPVVNSNGQKTGTVINTSA